LGGHPRLAAILLTTMLAPFTAHAIDCSRTSTGRTPLDDLGAGAYLGAFPGGLYPDGSNAPPPGPWLADGLARAAAIEPLDAQGAPDPAGAVILECMGMSNAAQEFGTETNGVLKFAQRAKLDPDTHPRLHPINGCLSSGTTVQWSDPDGEWWDHFRTQPSVQVPGFAGSIEQVQAIWFKVGVAHPARTFPTLPSPDAHAYAHARQIYDALRVVAQQVPNLQMLFLSTRSYGGYIDPSGDLSPEPYPYESGFSVKWIVESQIREVATGWSIRSVSGSGAWTTARASCRGSHGARTSGRTARRRARTASRGTAMHSARTATAATSRSTASTRADGVSRRCRRSCSPS